MILAEPIEFTTVVACPACGSSGAAEAISLPRYPMTEIFCSEAHDESGSAHALSQSVDVCVACGHAFLRRQISPRVLYGADYQTRSSSSSAATDALDRLLVFLEGYHRLSEFNLCVDVGANDGSLLKMLPSRGFEGRRVGIDPSWTDWTDGIEGHTAFAEEVDFERIVGQSGKTLYVASHVLEHVAQPLDFLRAVADAMRPGDIFLLQFPALETMATELRFDQVHHQHFHYFSRSSFGQALEMSGLRLKVSHIDWQHYGAATCLVEKRSSNSGQQETDSWHTLWVNLTASAAPMHEILVSKFDRFCDLQLAVDEALFPGPFVALGAGLMTPIVFYHLPRSSANCESILDDDEGKWGLRYCHTPATIEAIPPTLDGRVAFVSGAVSRRAGRTLVRRAIELSARNVVTPVINL